MVDLNKNQTGLSDQYNYVQMDEKQGKVEITRCVTYVPAGSVNLWTGMSEFVSESKLG